jgi:hypothetical protein
MMDKWEYWMWPIHSFNAETKVPHDDRQPGRIFCKCVVNTETFLDNRIYICILKKGIYIKRDIRKPVAYDETLAGPFPTVDAAKLATKFIPDQPE